MCFKVKQKDKTLAMEEGKSSHEMSFRADMRDLIAVCWTKIDRKSKKVNFLIN